MINSSIEITENEYLIKLNRSKFDLSFIRSLMRIVEVSNPSEDYVIADKDFSDQDQSSRSDYFSHLDDK
jgi:hypothetical protein